MASASRSIQFAVASAVRFWTLSVAPILRIAPLRAAGVREMEVALWGTGFQCVRQLKVELDFGDDAIGGGAEEFAEEKGI